MITESTSYKYNCNYSDYWSVISLAYRWQDTLETEASTNTNINPGSHPKYLGLFLEPVLQGAWQGRYITPHLQKSLIIHTVLVEGKNKEFVDQ
jgi:hypothetical protein